jgi:hypothetical protein
MASNNRFDKNQNESEVYETSLKSKLLDIYSTFAQHLLDILNAINDTLPGTIFFVFLAFIFLSRVIGPTFARHLLNICSTFARHLLNILDAIRGTLLEITFFVFLVFIFLATYLSILYYVKSEEIYKTICYFLWIPTIIFGIISLLGFYFVWIDINRNQIEEPNNGQ